MNVIRYPTDIKEHQYYKPILVRSAEGDKHGLLDTKLNVVVGMYYNRPYYPRGKEKATKYVSQKKFNAGINLFGFHCTHVEDNIYELI